MNFSHSAARSRRAFGPTRAWLLGGCALIAGALPAVAQSPAPAAPAAAQSQSFAIVAGQPLGDALIAFGRQSGWQISVNPALVSGRTSPGVSGAIPPETALTRLLDGSGLIWRKTDDASAVVEAVNAGGAMQLGAVTVQGQAPASPDPDATEGSRSYAVSRARVGQKSAASLKEIPQQVSVIPHARIEEENITRLEDAMQTATGVTVLPTDPGRGAIFVRGFELDTYYIDGIPSTVSSAYGTQPDMFMFDRIELLRGPSGIVGGAGEPGGTVNLARKRALAEPGGTASVSVGSWDAYRGEMDVTSAMNAEKTVRGRLVAAYDTRNSFVDDAGTDSKLAYGTVEVDLTPATTLSFALSHDEKDKVPNLGLPAYANGTLLDVSRSTNVGADWNRFDSSDTQGLVELEHRLASGGEIKAAARVVSRETDFKYAFSSSVVNPTTGTFNMNATERHWDEQGVATDLHLTQPVEAWGLTHTFTVGTDYRYTNSGLTTGTRAAATGRTVDNAASIPEIDVPQTSDSDTRLEQNAVYAEARVKPIAPLTLIAGARLASYDLKQTNNLTDVETDKSENGVFVPFTGAVLDVTDEISTYVSYSEAFQPQTNTTFEGDVIDPRESKQVEVGVKGGFLDDRLNAQIGLYRLIDRNRTMADPEHTGFSTASGKVVVKGIDAEITGRVTENLELFAGYSYVLSETHVAATGVGNTFSTWTPKHTLNLRARYSFDEGLLDDMWVAGGMRATSSYYSESTSGALSGTRWTQDGFAVFDAQVGYDFTESVSATLTLNNLFDKTYYARAGNGSGTTFGYYGEPFNAMLKLTAKF